MRGWKLGCLVLILGQCLLGGAFLALGRWIAGPIEGAGVACSGQPVPGAAAGPTRVLAFLRSDVSDDFYVRPALVEAPWVDAETAEAATVVVCVERDEPTTVETCNYVDGSVYTRVRHARRARAVSALDGHTLAETVVYGDEPAACPASIETGGGGGPSIGIRVMGIPVASVGGAEAHGATSEQLDGGDVGSAHLIAALGSAVR